MTADVVLAKLASIERCLTRIRKLAGKDPAQALESLDTEEIVVLNLQRAIQAAIDLAAHLIAGRGWGLPDSLKGHFRILSEQGVIAADLSERLQKMIGFRNIAIHDYARIDRDVLAAIVRDRLVDLDELGRAVRRFLDA